MNTSSENPISLLELNRRITRALTAMPGLENVWVTAETSDLRTSGGHCYMELVQKDESGRQLAKCRAAIWASAFARLSAKFSSATGSALRSDMKIMVRVSVSHHAVYGMCLVISDINPEYTLGDLARRRNEILARLKREGVYDFNRSLPWSFTPCRIAVISARGAAGFDDFMKHLHNNPLRLRFTTDLYEASMQGVNTSASVIAAMEAVMERVDSYDCVVIIRGGGAVSELAAFDDYMLALHVAQFPLPVIVGIGHERDVTVLDYVANTRVKTPTAAAEILIARMTEAYAAAADTGRDILATVRSIVAARREQLAYYSGLLPARVQNVLAEQRRITGRNASQAVLQAVTAVVERQRRLVGREAVENLSHLVSSAISRQRRLTGEELVASVTHASRSVFNRHNARLQALGEILDVLSPEATLRRGYTITRRNGKAVSNGDILRTGDVITTVFACGEAVISRVEKD